MTIGRIAVLGLAMFAGGALAQSAGPVAMDRPVKIGDAEAVCTGIGLEARENPLWRDYPLKVEVVGRGGQYLGDVHVMLSRERVSVAELTCGGPWILFRVPPGRYQVEARTEGRSVVSPARVPDSGQGRVILRFTDLGGEISVDVQPPPPPPQ